MISCSCLRGRPVSRTLVKLDRDPLVGRQQSWYVSRGVILSPLVLKARLERSFLIVRQHNV
jgi:hypothetical protein